MFGHDTRRGLSVGFIIGATTTMLLAAAAAFILAPARRSDRVR